MGVLAAYAVPHPPLIVPAVGEGQEAAISDTSAAFEEVARRVAGHSPDTIVVISPHAPMFRDGFFVSRTSEETGSMAAFRQPQEILSVTIDEPFANLLSSEMKKRGIAVATGHSDLGEIDHGTFVPLHFLDKALDLQEVRIVRIGLSGLPSQDHRLVGELIALTAQELNRKCVVIASGDWSHKLTVDGPYGFAPEGPEFDALLAEILSSGKLDGLFELDEGLCDKAAECGLRSFQIMSGALKGTAFNSELLSYEGPFGVGYGVAAFEVEDGPSTSQQEAMLEGETSGFDPLVSLARHAVEEFVVSGNVACAPENFPKKYMHEKAGVFVSLHEKGQLRGCIGTIEPRHRSIAEEVVSNAISASTSDPRFPPVEIDELDHIEYSVDVLGKPEPIDSLIELDPRRYGVIVTHGHKRGLLLPDLEGVDTAMDQVAIAKRKAGIYPNEKAKLERFEVIRHTAGGAPRKP